MRSRQDLVEQFSSFLPFEGDRPQPWVSEPRLRRNMERACQGQPEATGANLWALYWHKQWHEHWPRQGPPQEQKPGQKPGRTPGQHQGLKESSSPTRTVPPALATIAQQHLAAYAQESCYWAAYKTHQQFRHTNQPGLALGLADLFQMAIAQIDKILRGFNPQAGTDFITYAGMTFKSLIRETLRQQRITDICSDWSLLRKLSRKRLATALAAKGLDPDTCNRYLLAWECFKLCYVPQQASATRALTKPDAATWEAIANQYNRDRLSQLDLQAPSIRPDQLEPWLLTCAAAARAYLYPAQVSANTSLGEPEDGNEYLDRFSSDDHPPLEALIQLEEQRDRTQQRQALLTEIQQILGHLDTETQQLLTFYYRDNLTQQDMAQRLGVKQYTVSRRLTKIRTQLLEVLAQWASATLSPGQHPESPDSLHTGLNPDLLKTLQTEMDAWLVSHYGNQPPKPNP